MLGIDIYMMQTLDISLLWMEPIANNQISLWQTSIKIFGVFKIQYNGQYCWVLFCFLDDFRFLLSLIYFFKFSFISIPILNIGIYCQKLSHLVMPMPRPHHLTLQLLMAEIQILTSHIWAIAPTALWLELFLKKNSYLHTHTSHMCGKN